LAGYRRQWISSIKRALQPLIVHEVSQQARF